MPAGYYPDLKAAMDRAEALKQKDLGTSEMLRAMALELEAYRNARADKLPALPAKVFSPPEPEATDDVAPEPDA